MFAILTTYTYTHGNMYIERYEIVAWLSYKLVMSEILHAWI